MASRLFSRFKVSSRAFNSAASQVAPRLSPLALVGLFTAGSATTYALNHLDVLPSKPLRKSFNSSPFLNATQLEASLHNLPALKAMREASDADDWYEARPTSTFPESRRVHHMTAGALRGPGLVGVPPLARVKKDESQAVVFVHLGRDLCAHDGIIHGGMLATVLDEMLARVAIKNLPDKVGVTASLTVNYRAPTTADQWVMVKVDLDSAQGRKAKVTGRIENLSGAVLADASALFVQPKYASELLDRTTLEQAMGPVITPAEKLVFNSPSNDRVWREGTVA